LLLIAGCTTDLAEAAHLKIGKVSTARLPLVGQYQLEYWRRVASFRWSDFDEGGKASGA
jgi:hypothetical protein